jgi:hypothetical protein
MATTGAPQQQPGRAPVEVKAPPPPRVPFHDLPIGARTHVGHAGLERAAHRDPRVGIAMATHHPEPTAPAYAVAAEPA